MKYYDVVHGSPEWGKLRMGRPTSSDFEKILTPTGALSSQASEYENKLIAEIMLMEPIRTMEPTYWMERGTVMEAQAVDAYEFIQEVETVPGGFITDDRGHFGCSPDRYVKNDHAGLEIKCPAPHTHVNYLVNGADEKFMKKYRPQIQGQIFIAGFNYVDFMSYHPDLPPVIMRIEPDIAYQSKLREALEACRESMSRKIERLVADGHMKIDGYKAVVGEIEDKTNGNGHVPKNYLAAG